MAVIDFKSVGEKTTARRFQVQENQTPIGIKTPLQLGIKNDGIFAMHFSLLNQIRDNYRNLLLTNWGDRLGNYQFGANLKELSLEHGQENFDVEAISRIRDATQRWMSFVSPRTFEATRVPEASGHINIVKIRITYDILNISVTDQVVEVIIRVRG